MVTHLVHPTWPGRSPEKSLRTLPGRTCLGLQAPAGPRHTEQGQPCKYWEGQDPKSCSVCNPPAGQSLAWAGCTQGKVSAGPGQHLGTGQVPQLSSGQESGRFCLEFRKVSMKTVPRNQIQPWGNSELGSLLARRRLWGWWWHSCRTGTVLPHRPSNPHLTAHTYLGAIGGEKWLRVSE